MDIEENRSILEKEEDLDEILGFNESASNQQGYNKNRKDTAQKSIIKSILKIPSIKSSHLNTNIFSIKLPNFLKIQSAPFDELTHSTDVEKRLYDTASGVIRWRYITDDSGNIMKDNEGKPLKESNARLVKWKDGTYQVVVGDQVFNSATHEVANRYYTYTIILYTILILY